MPWGPSLQPLAMGLLVGVTEWGEPGSQGGDDTLWVPQVSKTSCLLQLDAKLCSARHSSRLEAGDLRADAASSLLSCPLFEALLIGPLGRSQVVYIGQ